MTSHPIPSQGLGIRVRRSKGKNVMSSDSIREVRLALILVQHLA